MLRLSQTEIRHGYKSIKKLALEAAKQGDFHESLYYIEKCSIIAQQFNFIYSDEELEDCLCNIGKNIICYPVENFFSINNRIIFYDDYCVPFILAIQYINALTYSGYNVYYITDIENEGKYETLSQSFNSPNKITPRFVSGDRFSFPNNFYRELISIKPCKVFLHTLANSKALPSLYHFPDGITKYLINLSDQTFWLGKNALDYVIEFRQFGVSVSQQRRGLSKEQQLLIPFYPAYEIANYEGLPPECSQNGKVIIFSGGDIYKVLDSRKTYWKLVKQILDNHQEVIFLFATKNNSIGNDFIDSFIKINHFEGRFIKIPFRHDINEVFSHIDIYMGTCPVSGSLMTQLAAINSVPILQYYYPGTPDDETEQILCYNESFQISYQDEDCFMAEATRLITDSQYRMDIGNRIRKAMISEEQFNILVAKTIRNNRSELGLCPFDIDYKNDLDKRWYELEANGFLNSLQFLWGILKDSNIIPIGIYIKHYLNKVFAHFTHERRKHT